MRRCSKSISLGPRDEKKSLEDVAQDLKGPDVVKVQLETTKGPLILQLVPGWAPAGCRRFLEMVDEGFFQAF